MTRWLNPIRSNQTGAVAVEFALLAPVFFACLFGAKVHLVTTGADLAPVASDLGLAIAPTVTLEDTPAGGEDGGDVRPRLQIATEAQRKPQPELHLHVDRTLQVQALATVMADAQNAGMVKVGIATDPLRPGEGK